MLSPRDDPYIGPISHSSPYEQTQPCDEEQTLVFLFITYNG